MRRRRRRALAVVSSANRETKIKHKARTHKQHKTNVAAGTICEYMPATFTYLLTLFPCAIS